MPKVRKIAPPPPEDDEPDDEEEDADEYERGAGGYDGWGYPASTPRRTDKGIKARTQRGKFGESWWAKRWIGALERLDMGARLQRGRSYARQGQVLSIAFAGATIKAKVQGSRARPYDVTIAIKPLSDAQWGQVAAELARQALFAAKLLAGEMPQEIEQAFAAAGVPLFPQRARDLTTDCSCPDYANPCKHIAAVYYLLGERFDDDPFLIFQARGRSREQIIAELRGLRSAEVAEADAPAAPQAEPAPALADLLTGFYKAGEDLAIIGAHVAEPPVEAALLRRLGPAPAGADAALRELYRAISRRAIERALGE